MALISSCTRLKSGQDTSCSNLVKKYYQQAVIINKEDIYSYTITNNYDSQEEDCKLHVNFILKPEKTGYLFRTNESGSNFFGSADKSLSDLKTVQYLHRVQILTAGANEQSKCILDSLDRGIYVAAMQLMDGTVEVYGIENGLTTADYTYDLQANGGATIISLESFENSEEDYLPMIYKSSREGGETVDFDSLFTNVDYRAHSSAFSEAFS